MLGGGNLKWNNPQISLKCIILNFLPRTVGNLPKNIIKCCVYLFQVKQSICILSKIQDCCKSAAFLFIRS